MHYMHISNHSGQQSISLLDWQAPARLYSTHGPSPWEKGTPQGWQQRPPQLGSKGCRTQPRIATRLAA